MSENTNTGVVDPGTGTGTTAGTESGTTTTSWLNAAVEAVMDLIDEMDNFADITRGALGTDTGLCCEIAPSTPAEIYLDKEGYFPITLALNGKHSNLQTLSETLNRITDTLTRRTTYPAGTGYKIVDITNSNMPRVIGREQNNAWLMACDIVIKIYRKDV